MREIKFRAWDKEKRCMIYNGSFNYSPWPEDYVSLRILFDGTVIGQMDDDGGKNGLHEHSATFTEKDRFVLMQFTGLRDKHGKEIYEGDICIGLMDGGLDYSNIRFVVEWRGGCFVNNYFNRPLNDEPQNLTVIGNIHENPELLEAKDEGMD